MKWWPRPRVTDEDLRQADSRLESAKRLAAKSRQTSARLDHELALNGWTKKFQTAMGRRA
jgi:hypothetical protein